MEKISLVQCYEYSTEILKEKILQSFENIGFDPAAFAFSRVAVKPNLLIPAKTKKAIITHHEFFRAVVQIVKDYKGIPVLVESPAFHSLKKTIEKTRYSEVVESEGIEIANSGKSKKLHYDGLKSFKSINISEAYFDADFIINLPKFKTHGLTYVTCAVKNLFGVLPGLSKSKTHMRIPSPENFSDFLVDLTGVLKFGFDKPKRLLHVVDAIIAQEGEGPGPAGTPKNMNVIIAGEDPVAVDYVAVEAAGLDFNKVLTITKGFNRDFCISSPKEVEIVGENIEKVRLTDFKPPRGTIMSNMVRWPLTSKHFKNLFIDRPFPLEEKCSLCLQCKKICPAKAIEKSEKKKKIPQYDYNKCIRCYCCMEICPEAAIKKKKGKLQWMAVA